MEGLTMAAKNRRFSNRLKEPSSIVGAAATIWGALQLPGAEALNDPNTMGALAMLVGGVFGVFVPEVGERD